MEPEGSLPSLQDVSTCIYPEPDQSSPQNFNLSLKNYRFACGFIWERKLFSGTYIKGRRQIGGVQEHDEEGTIWTGEGLNGRGFQKAAE
jgi:hypothetical protein